MLQLGLIVHSGKITKIVAYMIVIPT